jgi:hypothetical protein
VILTNYPFDRALVAERQRNRLAHSERMRRAERSREPRPTRRLTARWSFTSWLRGASIRRAAVATDSAAFSSTRP